MCFTKNIDFNKFSVYPITEVLNELATGFARTDKK